MSHELLQVIIPDEWNKSYFVFRKKMYVFKVQIGSVENFNNSNLVYLDILCKDKSGNNIKINDFTIYKSLNNEIATIVNDMYTIPFDKIGIIKSFKLCFNFNKFDYGLNNVFSFHFKIRNQNINSFITNPVTVVFSFCFVLKKMFINSIVFLFFLFLVIIN